MRFADKVFLLRFEDGSGLLLHLELQLEGDPDMPIRIAEYSAMLLRTIRKHQVPFSCMVIYLDPKVYREDPGEVVLVGPYDWKFCLNYRVVKLWEMDPEPIRLCLGI